MKTKVRNYEIRVLTAIMVMTLLTQIVLLVKSQPQGYTLVYSAPRAYGVDWMDVKALYMKTEENRLYFYIEYYGAMPNSKDCYREIGVYMDTDRNIQTGGVSNELGQDYYIYFYLYGDNSSSSASLYRWNSTSLSWRNIKNLKQNMRLAPELTYMEIWVDQQDIGYTSGGIDFYMDTYSYVKAMPKTELNYVVGSSVKQITVDGDPGDWGTIAPLITFPSRSINPPELEISSIYVANDADNLYMRIDVRGTPTANINTGKLNRWFTVYFDTDNNNNTGYISYGGAESYVEGAFRATPGKNYYANYYRYTGTGGDWNWQWVIGGSQYLNFSSVFELKMPIGHLGVGSGQTVGLYIPYGWWGLYRAIPRPVYSMAYPPGATTTTTTPTTIIGFFGSETVFLAVVAVAMVVEAVLIILLMRKAEYHRLHLLQLKTPNFFTQFNRPVPSFAYASVKVNQPPCFSSRWLEKEKEEGNIEYKLLVAASDEKRLQQLATQLNYRLNEGRGEAFYELGVSDEGETVGLTDEEAEESLRALDKITVMIGASYMVTRVEKGRRGKVFEILVRRTVDFPPIQVSVALLGNVDSGKSTLKGVLVSGKLDDGNGAAMSMVARYLHEITLRRSSSVSIHLLGFDSRGESINDGLGSYDESKIFLNGSKIVSLIDLAGHEKYLKTTIRGVLGNLPDYVCIVVGGNAGPIGTFREHLGLTVALKIPVFMVVTKVDMTPEEVLLKTVSDVESILKLPGVNKIPFIIKSKGDASLAARIVPHLRVCPIFLVSNIAGQGLPELKVFLNALPPKTDWSEKADMETLCFIDEKFYVEGVGLVIGGLVEQGIVKRDEMLLLGPFDDGSFRTVRVKSIHVNRVHVEKASAGQIAALAITNVDYDEIRTGMVLLDVEAKTYAVRRFTAEVRILHHPTTIMVGYEPVIQTRTVKQAAKIIRMGKEALRTGDTDLVEFEFIKRPEYVRVGDTFIFREGRTRGLGVVKKIKV